MITFGYPPGLLFLLVIPLLLLFMRKRSTPRRTIFTPFFLLATLKRPLAGKALVFFRLKKKHRRLLVSLIMTCLAFALADTSLVHEFRLPEKWLVVVDNLPLGTGEFEGERVHESIKRSLLELAEGLDKKDLLSVMTTSPVPTARTFRPGRELEEYIGGIPVARDFPSLEKALASADDLAGHSRRAALFSPRSEAWRTGLADARNGEKFVIPQDRHRASGNAGIVSARIRPSAAGGGSYDVFLAVMAPEDAAEVDLRVEHNGRPHSLSGRLPTPDGRGHLFARGLSLSPGEITFAIEVDDAYPGDDTFTAVLAEPPPVDLSLEGEGAPVFEAALTSFERFRMVEAGEAEVALFLGDSPSSLDRPSLVIFPSRDRMGLSFRELVDAVGDISWHPDHPVTAGVRPGGLRPRRIARYSFDREFESVAEVDGVPILLAGRRDGHRVVVWAFNPLANDLFLKPEFVILLHESVTWLSESEGTPGDEPLLSPRLTTAGGEVAMPAGVPGLFAERRSEERSIDLLPLLLATVLLGGTYLALADTLAGEEES